MRAVGYRRLGPAAEVLHLEIRPIPEAPGAGEVIIRLHASGINPHDTKARAGWTGGTPPEDFFIPHSDGAGVVTAVGAGVDLAIGARVWVFGAPHGAGTAADYLRIPAWRVLPLPDALDFAEGASLGVPLLTAWLAVLADGPVMDQVLLVQGGGGAVGEAAVALGVAFGARVVATARSADSAARAAARGALAVRAPDDPALSQFIADMTGGAGVPRVVEVDFGANQTRNLAMLADHGTLASYSATSDKFPTLDYYGFARKGARISFVQGMKLTPAHIVRARADLLPLLAQGQLRPTIAARFALDEAAAAHEMVERGAGGNVVLMLN
ncbi:alcohol dehydrogenase catalytic domain-containing protein [Ketogulonicigenium vulgare]|uniref:alcohol dehydrogenase catalytic domain-containing protein n=1 Tax=Ketogulonicigenium vulgare TaxID=92945 RepID=UPI0005C4BAC6|nr:zinc-binding dehydrogenase [Ketogulonicigenium vulgare]